MNSGRPFPISPLVNVLFVVLVLVLLATGVLDWIGLGVAGTGNATEDASVDGPLVVEIRPEGLHLHGAAVPDDVLVALIGERLARRPDQRVVIHLAHGAELEEVRRVLDQLAGAGVTRMSLMHPDIPHRDSE